MLKICTYSTKLNNYNQHSIQKEAIGVINISGRVSILISQSEPLFHSDLLDY